MPNLKFKAISETTNKLMPTNSLKAICINSDRLTEDEFDNLKILQFTGFQDTKGNDIYDGDILTDRVEVDSKIINSKQKVFWNEPTGSWHLDCSFKQNKTSSEELWLALNDFKYTLLK